MLLGGARAYNATPGSSTLSTRLGTWSEWVGEKTRKTANQGAAGPNSSGILGEGNNKESTDEADPEKTR